MFRLTLTPALAAFSGKRFIPEYDFIWTYIGWYIVEHSTCRHTILVRG